MEKLKTGTLLIILGNLLYLAYTFLVKTNQVILVISVMAYY